MHLELTLALIVLFFGIKGLIGVLSSGNPEQAIEKKTEQLEKFKKSANNTKAYVIAWITGVVFCVLLITLSLTYIYSRFN